MNLFVIGVGVTEAITAVATRALRRVATENFPTLDPSTFWVMQDQGFMAASIHHGELAAPRRYVDTAPDGAVTFYDGVPVSARAGVDGRDARTHAQHWGDLPDALDGQFVVARVQPTARSVEVHTDSLGLEQVYALGRSGSRILSNSVAILRVVAGDVSLDLEGAAYMATMGWVAADRTLLEQVQVVPSGYSLRWVDGALTESSSPFSRAALSARGRPRKADVAEVALSLTAMVTSLADLSSSLRCPLTAGRDSRLLAALCLHVGTRTEYYTYGRPGDTDADVAVEIALSSGLPHELQDQTFRNDTSWRSSADRLIRHGDGLASLRLVSLAEPPLKDLPVGLWGAGGEYARAPYATPRLVVGPCNSSAVLHALEARLIRPRGGLVTPFALKQARRYLKQFFDGAAADGVNGFDTLGVFYAEERTRRWAYTNNRLNSPERDIFSPFCTRPYVRAAYTLTRRQAYADLLHKQLMEQLAPQLLQVRYEEPWPSRLPGVAPMADTLQTARKRARAATMRLAFRRGGSKAASWRSAMRSTWFEQEREHLRGLCLDQQASRLWEVVDRPTFDRLMSPVTPAGQRLRYLPHLLDSITLFAYADSLSAKPLADGRPA